MRLNYRKPRNFSKKCEKLAKDDFFGFFGRLQDIAVAIVFWTGIRYSWYPKNALKCISLIDMHVCAIEVSSLYPERKGCSWLFNNKITCQDVLGIIIGLEIIALEQLVTQLKTHSFLISLLTAATCKFSSYCKYYQQDAHTCHDDKEAKSYCGARWQFDQYSKGHRDIGVNIANLFVIRLHRSDISSNKESWKSECWKRLFPAKVR